MDETRPVAEVVGRPQSSGWRANLRTLAAVMRKGARPRIPDEPRRPRFINPLRAPEERPALFTEILDWLWAPLMVVWPLSVTFTFLVAQEVSQRPFDRDLAESLDLITGHVRESKGQVSLQIAIPARELVHASAADHVYYTVLGLQGEFIDGDEALPQPPAGTAVTPGTTHFRADQVAGEEVRVAFTWVEFNRAPAGSKPVLVQVAETMERRNQLANEIVRGVIVPQFVILPLAVILVWFGLTRGLAPLQALRDRIRDRRPDDMAPIDPQAAPEELEPLLTAFNELLQRMQHNMAAQKRFISEVAHQMKTPIAGLRTQAELALRETDADQLRRSLRQIAGSSERATHVINQLLSLARAEHQATDLAAFEPVDLGALASEVLRDFVPVALSRGIDLGLEAEPAAAIIGVPLLLREAIKNLVDNAIRYTPDGGTVTARVRGLGNAVHFECEDTGPGIPLHERPLVFERFYRGADTRVEGTGLGLAIVREIVAQHDGLVRITSNPRAPDPDWPGTLISVEFSHLAGGAPMVDVGETGEKHRAVDA